MAVIVGEAAVRLRPETSTFAGEAESEVDGALPGVAKKAAGYFVAAFAAVKVGEFLKDAVSQASDLNESASKVGVVFGSMSGEVQAFAKDAATSMGISQQQALEATGTFGNLAVSLGLSQKQSADMSTSFVKLAGDLASFNNVDPQQALEALRSGLTGETEPLKQFGVNLNQAAIQQEAVRLGLAKGTGQLTASAQAQAAYSLIMQQTTTAQGDFARTSAGLANQTRIMAAQFTDVKANIGGAFLPFVNLGAAAVTHALMPALLTGTSYLKDFGSAVSSTAGYFSAGLTDSDVTGLATATTGLGESLQMLMLNAGSAANVAQGEWYTFTDAVKGGGEGVLATEPTFVGFLARFGTGLHGLAENASSAWMTVRTSASTALAPLASELAPTMLSVRASIRSIFDTGALAGSGSGFLGFLNGIIGQAAPIITGLIDRVAPIIATILPTIGNAVAAIVPVISTVFSQLGPMIGQILPVIEQVAGIWRQVFLAAFEALLPVIPPLLSTLGQLVTTLLGGLMPVISQLAPLISTLINTGMNQLKAVFAAIVPILPPLISAVGQVAQVLAGALLQVVQALMPVLPVLANALGQIAAAIGGALIGAVNALAPLLPVLINAFMTLFQAAITPLMPLLPALAGLIGPLANIVVILVQAITPLIPVIVQVVTMLVQLAITAILPLMPIVTILVNLISILAQVLIPIVTIVLQVTGAILGFAGALLGGVVGAISGVIGWFQRLFSAVSGIFASIGGAISGAFSGVSDFVRHIFDDVLGIIKTAINAYISIINGAIGLINHGLIDTANHIPFVNIPHIPLIPKLHEGGFFDSQDPSGEGLALLRNNELVATPEQQSLANDLLGKLLAGNLVPGAPGAPGAPGTPGAGVQVVQHITQQPGEDGTVLAARVTQGVVWNLNAGITRRVGTAAEVTP